MNPCAFEPDLDCVPTVDIALMARRQVARQRQTDLAPTASIGPLASLSLGWPQSFPSSGLGPTAVQSVIRACLALVQSAFSVPEFLCPDKQPIRVSRDRPAARRQLLRTVERQDRFAVAGDQPVATDRIPPASVPESEAKKRCPLAQAWWSMCECAPWRPKQHLCFDGIKEANGLPVPAVRCMLWPMAEPWRTLKGANSAEKGLA
jgi:hypothetical protein